MRSSRSIPPLALLLFWICVYGLTTYPGPGGRINYGDSVWKQIIPISGCTPHVTGFPQYILISKLFNQLPSQLPPFRSAAYRVASISVVFGALAVLMLYAIMGELGLGRWAAAWTASIYGASYTFWTQATEAEAYTLNAFLFASVTWLFLRSQRTGRQAFLLAGCLLYALSFGTHVTLILLLPGLFFLIWRRDPAVFKSPELIAWAMGCVLLSLLQYLYLHQVYFSDTAFADFADFLTGGRWKNEALQFQAFRLTQELTRLAWLMEKQFTFLGLALAGLGAWRLYQASRTILAFFLLVFFCYVTFSLGYKIADIEVYYLPAFMILAVFAGIGISWLGERKQRTALAIGAVVLIWQASLNILVRDIVVRENPYLENLVELAKQTPPGSTLLLTDPEWMAGFYYTQLADYITYSGEFGSLRIEPPQKWPRCPPLPNRYTHRVLADPQNLQTGESFYLRRADEGRLPWPHDLSLHWSAARRESDILLARRRE